MERGTCNKAGRSWRCECLGSGTCCWSTGIWCSSGRTPDMVASGIWSTPPPAPYLPWLSRAYEEEEEESLASLALLGQTKLAVYRIPKIAKHSWYFTEVCCALLRRRELDGSLEVNICVCVEQLLYWINQGSTAAFCTKMPNNSLRQQ